MIKAETSPTLLPVSSLNDCVRESWSRTDPRAGNSADQGFLLLGMSFGSCLQVSVKQAVTFVLVLN